METNNLPHHVGIIMDGNGRWAKSKGKPRSYGHRVGSDNVERIVTHAFDRGVKVISLYAFSSENWARPKEEVDELMRLLKVYFTKFIKKFTKKGVKLNVMGDISALTPELQKVILDGEKKTEKFTEYVLNIGMNYGGRQEIVMAVNKLIQEGKPITVESISQNLYTFDMGEPDLIIRTGGELRLSNFMLYQGAYSELYFTDVLWPEFSPKEFDLALTDYAGRKRRFGKVQ